MSPAYEARVTVQRYVPWGTRFPIGGQISGSRGLWTLSFGIRDRVGFALTWERVA